MHRASPKKVEWRRYKEVSVPWAHYDACRLSECNKMRKKVHFIEID